MRRFVIAAALGVGLISTTGLAGSAFARPVSEAMHARPVQPVHYEYSHGRFDRHEERAFRGHHHRHEWRRGYDYDRW